MKIDTKKVLTTEQTDALFNILKSRFEIHMDRHKELGWSDVKAKLEIHSKKLWSLNEMERTGGEPDVICHDPNSVEYIFYDCCEESPKGRRSLFYDKKAWESRKEHKPSGNVVDAAYTMGIELLTKDEYLKLQQFGPFDAKTSSWLKTPKEIRELGGAIFGDYRYGHVFFYHNGAESYYAARGFRGLLKV